MKKFIFILILAVISVGANAQFARGVKMTQATTDTIKTGALTVTKILPLTAGYSTVSIQPVLTKKSGTVAGKVYLYGTVDGTNYIKLDSLTLSDQATNTAIFNVTPAKHSQYKIQGVGNGTMNALLSVWYLVRKYITE